MFELTEKRKTVELMNADMAQMLKEMKEQETELKNTEHELEAKEHEFQMVKTERNSQIKLLAEQLQEQTVYNEELKTEITSLQGEKEIWDIEKCELIDLMKSLGNYYIYVVLYWY